MAKKKKPKAKDNEKTEKSDFAARMAAARAKKGKKKKR